MPLPLLFIGIAAATGAAGIDQTAHAIGHNKNANMINDRANAKVENAKRKLEAKRGEVESSLESLGHEKLEILQGNTMDFVHTFEQIKNVDFQSSLGLEELKNLHIDQKSFTELKELGNFAVEVAGGLAGGVTGGTLAALGAYGAAGAFASASTGTAIASLSGAAATNATLAFFGGGALSAGGLGMAGGTAVLGGLVAGPALLVMGGILNVTTQEKLSKALTNKAQADEIAESLDAASDQCVAIRRRAYMFTNLLARLDAYFLPQIWKMQEIISEEGTDYRQYALESKHAVAATASTATSIKAVLDTPILTQDGDLTEASGNVTKQIGRIIYRQ